MSFNIKAVLGTVAPFLTAALPGPFGGLANAAIGKALGLKDGASNDDVQAAIDKGTLTGDQLAAIKVAEMDFQKTMAQLGYEDAEKLAAIAAGDRADARNREIQTKDWTPRILAGAVVLLTAFGEGYLLIHGMPANANAAIVGRILGTLDSALVLVLGYYFGSSAGSDRKTELLSQAAPVTQK